MSQSKNLTGKGTNILLVEDHEVFRMGLKELLSDEDDLYICGEADNINTAWKLVNDLKPDFMIVDIGLKGDDGIELQTSCHKAKSA